MREADSLTNADAEYLAQIWVDCEERLGPDTELVDLRREAVDDSVRLVARYRLGEHERESAAVGESMLAAHVVLRARILFDRIRFGFSDVLERPIE